MKTTRLDRLAEEIVNELFYRGRYIETYGDRLKAVKETLGKSFLVAKKPAKRKAAIK